MKFIKLIVQASLIAMFALYALHAHAQTMGEYAGTTASVGTGASSAGTTIGSIGNSDLGGSSTWGASSLGASFDERAGAMSGSGLGQDFEARAGGSGASNGEARWPQSQLDAQSSDRFSQSSDRFNTADRFTQRTELSDSDRFPPSRLTENGSGLDTSYSSSSGLDKSYNSLDN